MLINKKGQYHLENGINNQDFGFITSNKLAGRIDKCVVDGCSEGKHTEVGAKLFPRFYANMNINATDITGSLTSIMKEMSYALFLDTPQDLLNYLAFTTLICHEYEDSFFVSSIGDGYIIAQRQDDTFEFIDLDTDCGGCPPYPIYNIINKDCLLSYKEGVVAQEKMFMKPDYKNVGVATDGLRFVLRDGQLKEEFVQLLLKGKETPIKLFINRNQKVFQDDITIAF